jgi:hypothetical protein
MVFGVPFCRHIPGAGRHGELGAKLSIPGEYALMRERSSWFERPTDGFCST